MYYTKESLIDFTRNKMEGRGWIAIKNDFTKVWRKFSELPTDSNVRYFLIDEVGTKDCKKYGFDIDLLTHYSTCQKKDPRDARGIFAELLDNLDQILAGNYVAKAELSRQKKEAAEARKKAKKEMLEADCKTFNADFFAENSFGENGYLRALDEIGRRLQNGQYSDLVLNGLIKLSYRTKSKNKNLGYTVDVSICKRTCSFEYDSKYGDLWEDLDDNIRREIFRTMLNGASFSENDVDMSFARSEWVDKFCEAGKKDDENTIIYDLLSIYFSPDSFYQDKNLGYYCYRNTYDKVGLNLGGVLREYLCSNFPDTKWMNQELKKLSGVPGLEKCFDKE